MLAFDPFAESYYDDPFSVYKQMRDEARAYYHEELDCYFLSRFEDVWEAVNSGHFSHRKGTNTQEKYTICSMGCMAKPLQGPVLYDLWCR